MPPSLSTPEVPGMTWHPLILAADYTHHITTGTPWFSDLPTALIGRVAGQQPPQILHPNFMLIEEHETLHNKIHTTYNNKNYWLPIVNRKKSRIFHCETTPFENKKRNEI